ncbi:MAG: PEP-CTERM sorting domain-containing protein [Pirellulales bacterium]
MKRFALVVAILALCATSVNAATATLRLKCNLDAQTWDLYGIVSQGDNGGLAGWAVAMTNVADIVLKSPEVALSLEHGMVGAGFNFLKATAPNAFGSCQDSTKAALYQEFGVGQAPGVIVGFPGVIPDVPYDYPVLLASGKLVGDGPFNRQNPQNLPAFRTARINLYTAAGQSGNLGDITLAHLQTERIFVPEPSTIVLGALGALGLMLGWCRRRKAAW